MKDFKGKTAVITGAASGIGYALAEKFANEGMNIVLADIEQDALDIAVKKKTILPFPIDQLLQQALIVEHVAIHHHNRLAWLALFAERPQRRDGSQRKVRVEYSSDKISRTDLQQLFFDHFTIIADADYQFVNTDLGENSNEAFQEADTIKSQ